MRTIDADALKVYFESSIALCNEWIATAKDKETKIRASAVKTFIGEVLIAINNAPTVCNDNYSMGYRDGVRKVLSERPQGHWIVDEEHSITMTLYKCTNCDYFGGALHYNYCPHCGADMRKETNND